MRKKCWLSVRRPVMVWRPELQQHLAMEQIRWVLCLKKNQTEDVQQQQDFTIQEHLKKKKKKEGLYAKSINGDAFSTEIKEQVIETIKADLGTVDMVIYSLAAPRRTTPDGHKYASVLKTVGEEYSNKTLVLKDNTITEAHIPAATEDEIENTIKSNGRRRLD